MAHSLSIQGMKNDGSRAVSKSRQRSKSKLSKRDLSYCQRLIQNIDCIESNHWSSAAEVRTSRPGLDVPWTNSHDELLNTRTTSQSESSNSQIFPSREQRTRSILLASPAEIRQLILYNILDDNDISSLDLAIQARPLLQVCQTIKADIERVLPQWQARKAELAKHRQIQQGAFDAYISDLMAPVISHSKVLRKRKQARGYPRTRERRRGEWDKRVEKRKMAPREDVYPSDQRKSRVDYRCARHSEAERVDIEN